VEVDSSLLVREPGWALLELDLAQGEAIFLDVGENFDSAAQPFCFAAMARVARRVARVPFDVFVSMSKLFGPRPRIIHLFNIGHCGSTLLHNVFNASGEAWSISEPKFTWSVAMAKSSIGKQDLLELARASLDFVARYPLPQPRDTIVIKHVSQGLSGLDIWRGVEPQSKNLFLYRNAVAWSDSLYGFLQRLGRPKAMPRESRKFSWDVLSGGEPVAFLDGVLSLDDEQLDYWDLAACAWVLQLRQVQDARRLGMNIHSIRYDELTQNKRVVLETMFAYCGLDEGKVSAALDAFDRDAHEGEVTSHDKPVEKLTDEAKARIRQILRHARFAMDPDVMI
jgi:hypothetical protein